MPVADPCLIHDTHEDDLNWDDGDYKLADPSYAVEQGSTMEDEKEASDEAEDTSTGRARVV